MWEQCFLDAWGHLPTETKYRTITLFKAWMYDSLVHPETELPKLPPPLNRNWETTARKHWYYDTKNNPPGRIRQVFTNPSQHIRTFIEELGVSITQNQSLTLQKEIPGLATAIISAKSQVIKRQITINTVRINTTCRHNTMRT